MTVSSWAAIPAPAGGPDVKVALRRAAVQASRAPSVHNTQPWQFVLRRGLVEVHADWGRQVPAYDPLGRQLLMSCGCAVLNLRASLAASGYAADTIWSPDPRRPHVVATVVPSGEDPPDRELAELDRQVEHRRSNRGAFVPAVIEAATWRRLCAAAEAEGATLAAGPHGAWHVFEELTTLANRLHNDDPAYRAEVRAWTMPERGRLDGIPGGRAALSLVGLGDDAATGGGPHCLTLATAADDESAWLHAGAALERVLLEVSAHGMAARPMTQVIEVPHLRRRLCAEFGLEEQPQVVVLVGHAPLAPPTRRRRLVDVIAEVADPTPRR